MKKTIALAAVATVAFVGAAEARDQIRIVGSSTVFPFSSTVAEQFGQKTSFPAPVVESTGTGGGMKLFCGGVGADHPDMTGASRAMKKSEYDNCQANGVTDIMEVKFGTDGIAFAHSKEAVAFNTTREQLFLALAAEVPLDGELVENPYEMWSDIDPSLPEQEIEVLGPPPTSGTRDAFVELAMEAGCETALEGIELSEDRMEEVCQTMREDGLFIEAGENDNLIVQKLVANPNAFGIFGFSFLEQNSDRLKGNPIDGAEATFDNIASGAYPLSRPLFLYMKKAHIGVIPGMKEYGLELVSDVASGEDGYLVDKGLVPLPESARSELRSLVEDETTFSM